MQPLAARLPRPGPAALPPYWQSADGDQASIDLNGPGPGSITTSLSTLSGWTSGATYRVSFSLAANPDNTLSPQSCVRATTATHQQDYCFNVLNTDGQGTPASSANMGWQRHTFEFTGAPTDHLTFTSLDAPGDAWGPALDHITVEKLVPTTGPGVRHLFTGKERDQETGLDYFGARYLSAAQGRFTSADPTFLNILRVVNPQRWNRYSYAVNNPLKYIDPDGQEAIAIRYPGYQVGIRGNFTLPLGHAGVVIVRKDGSTRYFEYGRYAGPDGIVRNAGPSNVPTPALKRDASGKFTAESMGGLLQTLSDAAGKSGPVDALVLDTTEIEDQVMEAYLESRQRQNSDPNRQKYSLWRGHHCGTLICDALAAAGRPTPGLTYPPHTPGSIFDQLRWLSFWLQQFTYSPSKEDVKSRICYTDASGKQVCQ